MGDFTRPPPQRAERKAGVVGWQEVEETERAYAFPLSDGLQFEGGQGPCRWNGQAVAPAVVG